MFGLERELSVSAVAESLEQPLLDMEKRISVEAEENGICVAVGDDIMEDEEYTVLSDMMFY